MKKFFANILSKLSSFFTLTRIGVATILALFFWFMVMGDQGVIKFKRLIEMKNNLLAERETLNNDIEVLTKKKILLSNPANLELTIRKELGYVRPGEVIFEEKIADVKRAQTATPSNKSGTQVPSPEGPKTDAKSKATSEAPKPRTTSEKTTSKKPPESFTKN